VLAVVHDLADHGVGLISDQYQIHARGLRRSQRLTQGHNANLLALGTNKTDLVRDYFIVDEGLLALAAIFADRCSPFLRPIMSGPNPLTTA
jgi:hypothetical protein